MNPKSKGSAFERKFCKELSLWWSLGKSEDIFWRTGGSGSRATVHSSSGRLLKGQFGDVAAICPTGIPLLRISTFELKTGYGNDPITNILDRPNALHQQTWDKWIDQAEKDSTLSGSIGWSIVHQRKRRSAIVAFSNGIAELLQA